MTVDIIQNGYIFPDRKLVVKVDKTLNQNGDLVSRSATDIDIKLNIPVGISVISFTSDTTGVTYDVVNTTLFIPVVTSETPVSCFFMFQVDDTTTAQNSQWVITLTDITPNSNQTFTFSPIVLGGLLDEDILEIVGGLVGPQGETGATGPANTLAIGTVEDGVAAAATITGTAPNQTLNLVLPKGEDGVADNLTIGTVLTLPAGDDAVASITGTSPNKVLNLSIPRGQDGINSTGGEDNVQSDWNQVDDTADDYIRNKPVIPAAQVNSDWDSISGVSQILNKPSIPTLLSQLTNDTGFITQQLTAEEVQDFMSTALVHAGHTNVSVVYNDAVNRFEITATVSGGSVDGAIINMVKSGNDLIVTGINGAFNGTLLNIFKNTLYDVMRVGDILEWYVDGVKVKEINICCIVTKEDVGLGDVVNIDATKRENHTGVQSISTVTGLTEALESKQGTLVSGTNIKTVNNQSLLGSGNILITAPPTLISHTLLSYTKIDLKATTYNIVVAESSTFNIEFQSLTELTNDPRYTFDLVNHNFYVTSGATQSNFFTLNLSFESSADAKLNIIVKNVSAGIHANYSKVLKAAEADTITIENLFQNTSTTPIEIEVTSNSVVDHSVTVHDGILILKPGY